MKNQAILFHIVTPIIIDDGLTLLAPAEAEQIEFEA